jgi:hypothetical protein
MVSGRAPGVYSLYMISPSGETKPIKQADAAWWNCSNLGSSEGVISTSATPEKLNFLPPSSWTGAGGYSLELRYTASANTTLGTITKSKMMLPVICNGQLQVIGLASSAAVLGNNNFTIDTAAAAIAYVASTEAVVFRIRAKEGVVWKVGGDKVFLSLEDNA